MIPTPWELRGDYPGQMAFRTRVLDNGCWEFTGSIAGNGYGKLGRRLLAHRVAWEMAHGRPVPEGLVVDHQCHNLDLDCNDDSECQHRRCVNPDHLEAVTQRINSLRGKSIASFNFAKTHCKHGHEFTPENTYINPVARAGGRQCRTCRQIISSSRRDPNRARAARKAVA